MKQYRLKIDYYYATVYYSKNDIFEFSGDSYYCKRIARWFSKEFVENNPDIFELIEEPEPQGEVIEGYVRNKAIDNLRYVHSHINFSEKQTEKNNIPATLILNPKPKKEYVRWVSAEGLDFIKSRRARTFDSFNQANDHYIHKIKIIVEDSE